MAVPLFDTATPLAPIDATANGTPMNAPASAHCAGFMGSGGRDWMRSLSRVTPTRWCPGAWT